MSSKYVLVIDPFSSGAAFARRIKDIYGYNVIALITNQNLPDVVISTFRKEDYSDIFYMEDFYNTVSFIESCIGSPPSYIICGSEPGVMIFDRLCNLWNLPANDIALSESRRNKFQMQKRIKESGLKYIPFFKSSSKEEIIDWCVKNEFPGYVIKPINSFGTEGVCFCKNVQDVELAFSGLINTHDYSGNNNYELLIEQKIEGTEYVVDVVSCEGKHFAVNIFRYVKQEINQIPIYKQVITESVSDHPVLVSYVYDVLSSLGIHYGASHNEVIMTKNGPVLVESGARMHGGLGPMLVEECNSHSLIDLSIIARISPDDFSHQTNAVPVLKKYATEYFLSSPYSGIVDTVNIDVLCKDLSSYSFTTCKLKKGDYLNKTVDLITSYGGIVLFNYDRALMEADVKKISELESSGKLVSVVANDPA